MTTEQKQSIQAVAARYEVHGVSFISLLRLLSGTGADFSKSLTAARFALGQLYGEPEELTAAEREALDVENVTRYSQELEKERGHTMKLYDVLKASKLGAAFAPDMFTALFAEYIKGKAKETTNDSKEGGGRNVNRTGNKL